MNAGLIIGLIGFGILQIVWLVLLAKLVGKCTQLESVVCRLRDNVYYNIERNTKRYDSVVKNIEEIDRLMRKVEFSADNANIALKTLVDKIDEVIDELPIHLITHHQFENEREYNKMELMYDPETNKAHVDIVNGLSDCVVAAMTVANIEELIGEASTYFGIDCMEPNVVYVRNHERKVDIKVVRFVKEEEDIEEDE